MGKWAGALPGDASVFRQQQQRQDSEQHERRAADEGQHDQDMAQVASQRGADDLADEAYQVHAADEPAVTPDMLSLVYFTLVISLTGEHPEHGLVRSTQEGVRDTGKREAQDQKRDGRNEKQQILDRADDTEYYQALAASKQVGEDARRDLREQLGDMEERLEQA